jgi:hypothetical protein
MSPSIRRLTVPPVDVTAPQGPSTTGPARPGPGHRVAGPNSPSPGRKLTRSRHEQQPRSSRACASIRRYGRMLSWCWWLASWYRSAGSGPVGCAGWRCGRWRICGSRGGVWGLLARRRGPGCRDACSPNAPATACRPQRIRVAASSGWSPNSSATRSAQPQPPSWHRAAAVDRRTCRALGCPDRCTVGANSAFARASLMLSWLARGRHRGPSRRLDPSSCLT